MNGARPPPTERLAASRERMRQALAAHPSGATATPAGPAPAHPLRLVTSMLGALFGARLQPLAQRHPIALVLGAAVAGALLVRSRPWRWRVVPALVGGLLPLLVRKAVALTPSADWLAVIAALAAAPRHDDTARAPR